MLTWGSAGCTPLGWEDKTYPEADEAEVVETLNAKAPSEAQGAPGNVLTQSYIYAEFAEVRYSSCCALGPQSVSTLRFLFFIRHWGPVVLE